MYVAVVVIVGRTGATGTTVKTQPDGMLGILLDGIYSNHVGTGGYD